jgi:hypothetical protein
MKNGIKHIVTGLVAAAVALLAAAVQPSANNNGGHGENMAEPDSLPAATNCGDELAIGQTVYSVRDNRNYSYELPLKDDSCTVISLTPNPDYYGVEYISPPYPSLSLPHTFSSTLHPYPFIQGTTDNVMDYSWQNDMNTYTSNPHNRRYVCFWKSQWDIMRNDQSVK